MLVTPIIHKHLHQQVVEMENVLLHPILYEFTPLVKLVNLV